MAVVQRTLCGEPRESKTMNCPKCSAEFETISFNDIEVDRCTRCKGLWFDVLKKDDLLKIKGS